MANNPKRAQTKLYIFLIIILIIIVIIGLYYLIFSGNTTKNTNSTNQTNIQNNNTTNTTCINTNTKTYIKSDPNCLINFLCIQGTVAFKDNCGCGCEKMNQTQNNTAPKIYNVTIRNFTFIPQSLTINTGDSVTWRNLDYESHTITSDSGKELNSNALKTTGTFSHTFFKSGTYDYHCNIHPDMSGTIVVE